MAEQGCGLRETARSLGLMNETAMDETAMDDARATGLLRGVLLRPAVWLGVALGVIGFADLGPFEPWTTWILPLLALGYLVFGAARGQLRRPGVLRLQTIGLLGFTVLALVAMFVDPLIGQYLVAAGWVGHAVWDFAHRDGTVVPRWYVDFCIPVDLLVAASLVAAALL
jgi:hypothetical protein